MRAASFLVLAAAAVPSLATIYITAPVAATSWAAGTQQTIQWNDDGTNPALASWGSASVGIYVGSSSSQVLLQSITPSVDVATTSSIVFTPDASMGSNGQYYFVRFDSLNLTSTTNAPYMQQSFSSKFTLTGMTGTFNSTVGALVSSAGSAGIGSTTGAAGASTAASASTTGSKIATSTKSSSSSSASAAAAGKNGAMSSLPISALSVAAGVAATVFSAMLL
ncbi:uncharacterized protein BXZ73DRAFT_102220 [Epithele typhae]|uniref:uncharacterized protein n=1 Tax=Epithele typhae TaxID=378194 RepID=UPI0020072342|nr:uncharacterized protein BXZ73DRAFT_102220 [Epithele typhae]KAH9929067.1 hypothetical protein BXZ73DRAFT_102220 [Epithele typhae]